MTRSEFLRMGMIGMLGSIIPNELFRSPITSTEKDIYGGWKRRTFKATGYFRTEKSDRWWLVTPEGNAFLSFGINHFHTGWWRSAYNQDAWMQILNIKDEKEFSSALRAWLIETCNVYGFNTLGVHTDIPVVNTPNPQLPYMQTIQFVDISHWKSVIPDENFRDIFSDDFVLHCDELAKKIAAPLKNDPYLLGYAMADCPLFTEEDCRERPDNIYGARRSSRIGWPRRLRNLGKSAAGKQAYVRSMSIIYEGEIQRFNKAYSTTFASFEELESSENWRLTTDLSNTHETRDNTEFLKACVDQYYSVAKASILKYDPNHLFFGDKMNGNTDSAHTLLPVIAKHTDVFFYQMYGKYEIQKPSLDHWSGKVDIPIINGDSAFTHIKANMPRPYGPIAGTEAQNAEWTTDFFRKAFARSEFVGWHYCGLIDTPLKRVKKESDRQHSGLFDGYGNAYVRLNKAVSMCSEELYKVAINQ